MKYRILGSTNLRVSVIGVGTWQFGGEWGKEFTQDEADRILGRAKEVGINFIDTAECYGDHTSERLIGAATQRNRKDWIIATKFGHKYHGFLKRTDERTPSESAANPRFGTAIVHAPLRLTGLSEPSHDTRIARPARFVPGFFPSFQSGCPRSGRPAMMIVRSVCSLTSARYAGSVIF